MRDLLLSITVLFTVMAPYAVRGTSLCTIGDSLAVPLGWVWALPDDWDVTAHGVPGASAMWLWQHTPLDVCGPHDIVTVNLGTNDRYIGFPPAGFQAWLGLVLGELRSRSDTVMLWQVSPYLGVTSELCEDLGVICLNQFDLLDPEHYVDPTPQGGWFAHWEGAHPTNEGKRLMAGLVVHTVPEPGTAELIMCGAALFAIFNLGRMAYARRL